MRAARLYGYDQDLKGDEFLRLEEVGEPSIEEPDEVIVRVGGAGLCRTDLHVIQGLWDDALVVEPPYILGHENAGWIQDVGPAVRHVRPEDPVLVLPGLTDGVCAACRRGTDNLCESLVWIGIQRDGGFADLLKARERNMIGLPEGMEPSDAAPFADAGLTAYHAAKRASRLVEPNGTVVVIGVGGLGHVGIQVLRALSPVRILAIEISETARRLAEDLAVDEVIDGSQGPVEQVLGLTGGAGADAVLDFVAEGDVPGQAMAMLRPGGAYLVIGYGGKLEIPTMEFLSEKQVIGNIGGTSAEMMELLALAGRGKIRLETTEYPLERINEAIADLRDLRIRGRAVLVP
ncbi:MAG: NAD(P)-dependent alcohol dehydrogenase [Actinomycetota bacterium]